MTTQRTRHDSRGTARTSRRARADRRGNAMILVAGILVLLVITAAAYITSTQGGRVSAVASQQGATRDNNAEVVADALAEEISQALFVGPIDPADPALNPLNPVQSASSNWPRLKVPETIDVVVDPNPPRIVRTFPVERYWVPDVYNTTTSVFESDGFPDFTYNFTPYHVVPWTNWPDGGLPWPNGPGTYSSGIPGLAEENPWGNPGFGDTRWLRDTEPVRHATRADRHDSFRFWRHMTNIARANNGWRICRDISDVTDADSNGLGGLVSDLRIPVEQWLVSEYPSDLFYEPITGNSTYFRSTLTPDTGEFYLAWRHWFANEDEAPTFGGNWYGRSYLGSASIPPPTFGIPPNFLDLNDLNGNGITGEEGERPQDEFKRGSARWDVSRILAETDGDGFTDAFWFLAPTPVERGVRQIVAVSIVDNSGLLDANVATSFWPGDDYLVSTSDENGTRGETPADLAMSGQQSPWGAVPDPPPNWNVGFFDDDTNDERSFSYPSDYDGVVFPLYGEGDQVSWSNLRWADFLGELGVLDNVDTSMVGGLFPQTEAFGGMASALERRRYWRYAGSRPFNPLRGLTPFTLADEIELRMYHGNNYPWILSRFERATQVNASDQSFAFLRANDSFRETSEYLGQLSNAELLHDNRRKLTMYSGARNDLMPPWMWWNWRDISGTPDREDLPRLVEAAYDLNPASLAVDRFYKQSRLKLDLREPPPEDLLTYDGIDVRSDLRFRNLLFHERLPFVLQHALADLDINNAKTYLGDTQGGPADAIPMQKLAASLTANVLAYRDADDRAPLNDDASGLATGTYDIGAIPLPQWAGSQGSAMTVTGGTRFLGMEQQPFFVEAFVGHVYETWEIPGDPTTGDPGWTNFGREMIIQDGLMGTEDLESTVVAVQIANPYDEPIVLFDPGDPDLPRYQIKLFDQTEISLYDVAAQLGGGALYALPPARDGEPSTMILYSMENNISAGDGLKTQWIDFLDLAPADHPSTSILVDLHIVGGAVVPWSNDREDYDDVEMEDVTLARVYDPQGLDGGPYPVVIDRFNDTPGPVGDWFSVRVAEMGDNENRPPTYAEFNPPPPAMPAVDSFPLRPNMIPVAPEWTPLEQAETHWVQFVRVTRAWGNDFSPSGLSGFSDPSERNPRYIYATNQITTGGDQDVCLEDPSNPADRTYVVLDPRGLVYRRRQAVGSCPLIEGAGCAVGGNPCGDVNGDRWKGVSFSMARDPDSDPGDMNAPWLTLDYDPDPATDLNRRNRKPTFFDMNGGGATSFPDKGFYHSDYSLQMLQKNRDFQQVGELFNVWLYGHELKGDYDPILAKFIPMETVQTFSEYMAEQHRDPGTNNEHINRLQPGATIGEATAPTPTDPRNAIPVLPAGLRVLDAFVCDGRGQLRDFNGDGTISQAEIDAYANGETYFGNAIGASGRITPGLINVNTATEEVLETLPHWSKIVHANPSLVGASEFLRMGVSRGVISYRDRLENFNAGGVPLHRRGYPNGPNYKNRPSGVRGERGVAALGELRLADKPALGPVPGAGAFDTITPATWSIKAAAISPFSAPGAYISTDVTGENIDLTLGDEVAGDAEEENLLLSGASNILTTRSDVFTVYFRVRNFRQNPDTNVWDATDPRYIIDDTRYVMLVDRSEVNSPRDRPKILYLEKLPN